MKPCFCPIFSMPVSFLSPYTAHPVSLATFCMVPVSRRPSWCQRVASADKKDLSIRPYSYGSRTIYAYIYTSCMYTVYICTVHPCLDSSAQRAYICARCLLFWWQCLQITRMHTVASQLVLHALCVCGYYRHIFILSSKAGTIMTKLECMLK